MHAVLHLLLLVIRIYIWLLIAQAILSWLLAFGVINRYNRAVSVIGDFLYRVTEPALRPIESSRHLSACHFAEELVDHELGRRAPAAAGSTT